MNSKEMAVKEVKNGRLAMVAFIGFAVQALVSRTGPIEGLAAHLGNPAGRNITYYLTEGLTRELVGVAFFCVVFFVCLFGAARFCLFACRARALTTDTAALSLPHPPSQRSTRTEAATYYKGARRDALPPERNVNAAQEGGVCVCVRASKQARHCPPPSPVDPTRACFCPPPFHLSS